MVEYHINIESSDEEDAVPNRVSLQRRSDKID